MFSTLNKDDVSHIHVLVMQTELICPQHARRRRILADRYANSNVMRPASLGGIDERSMRFVKKCADAGDKSVDIFVSSQPESNRKEVDTYHAVDL